MKKYLLLLMLPLLLFGMASCDKEDDVNPIILDPLVGTWEVVDQGSQNVFEKGSLLDIPALNQIYEGYGGYRGVFTTYFPTIDGALVSDRVFSWSILEVENHQPLLEVVYQGELDGADAGNGNYSYKITKLTHTDMCWQVNMKGTGAPLSSDVAPTSPPSHKIQWHFEMQFCRFQKYH